MSARSPLIESLLTECRIQQKRVIFPEGDDPRVIQAAQRLLEWNAVKEVTLLSTADSVQAKQGDARLKIIHVTDPAVTTITSKVCETLLLKRHRPINESNIRSFASNPLYQAGALLSEGRADCAVAGCVANTADVIRAALATIGLADGIKTVSGSFIMDRMSNDRHEVFVFADCGVVIDPTVEQLTDIAACSAETLTKISGRQPIVAFLSFSTKGSADHPAAQKMQAAADLFKKKYPHITSDGELQFDAAYVRDVGHRKAPLSPVPGSTNCFIFPDLDAGNIAYKITQRLGGFGAYGPILQGLAKSYSDLSRGATADDIAISALINIIRSR